MAKLTGTSAAVGTRPAVGGGRGGTGPPEPTGLPEQLLSPGEALMTLFLANADNGHNVANDDLIEALRLRVREIQATQRSRGSRR